MLMRQVRWFAAKKNNQNWLYGFSSVLPALSQERRRVDRLWIQKDLNEKSQLARKRDLKLISASKGKLDDMVDHRPHQGLVLECGPLLVDRIKELEPFDQSESESMNNFPFWIALDSIVDPQNMGAIIRSCFLFGVDGIVVSTYDSAPFSSTVSKASAGALEVFESIYTTNNLSRFLSKSKENGWTVFGADINGKLLSKETTRLDRPSILVLGSEGNGMSPSVKQECDHLLSIENRVNNPYVDSLNVSVAAGIFLHSFLSM